jgi:hypothetical protein
MKLFILHYLNIIIYKNNKGLALKNQPLSFNMKEI